jgi:hypothetical protein
MKLPSLPAGINFVLNILLLLGSLCSIAISSWQYQNFSGDVRVYDDDPSNPHDSNWENNFCKGFPFKFLRPFATTFKDSGGSDTTFYCGYSDANTGYRFTVAILTVICTTLIIIKFLEDGLDTFSTVVLTILWFAVLVADCQAVANGQISCEKYFVDMQPAIDATCSNSVYGVSIAVTAILITIGVLRSWSAFSFGAEKPSATNAV